MICFKWMLTPFYTDLIITIFLIFIALPASYCEDDEQFSECKNSFKCGKLQDIGYPFWVQGRRPQFCGYQWYELKCEDDEYPLLDIEKKTFHLLHVDEATQIITIRHTNFREDGCPENTIYSNITTNETLFGPNIGNLSIYYGCSFLVSNLENPHNFSCIIDGEKESGAFYSDKPISSDKQTACSVSVEVPVPQKGLKELSNERATLGSVLNQEFDMKYYAELNLCSACNISGGICGSSSSSNSPQFVCLCRDQPHHLVCKERGKGMNVVVKILIGFGSLGAGILITCAAFAFYLRRNKKRYASSYLSRNISSEPSSSMTDVENMGRYFGVNIFTYNELEEATNNFDSSKELGDGGFGTVYYGKLRDGRVVAVKRLYENNYKRVEQFMNEVEILTRLRHQNLVALYGCTSRHSRELLLVYEYIPNGTVADHLHGERAKPGSLPWSIRMKIAIETASALKYLHASDIIHRDVKTNNILLDNNFSVKVADFGLSRLFPNDVTHISTAPQGTPGYVDPEYHQCYQLTDRSDVYSFGVVLMELISSMPAVDISRHRHEINLSNMAISKIQNDALHELVDPYLGFESDYKVRTMITAVAELAFQCLQSEKDMRPSMEEVLEGLKDIQSKVYNNVEKEEEVLDIPADTVVLLKSCPLPYSPDSVTATWISTDTTPNASG